MEHSFDDVKKLGEYENLIDEVSRKLIESLKEENELFIILEEELTKHSIDEKASKDNKLLSLRRLTQRQEVKQWIDDYRRKQTEVKQLRIRLDQVKGARDSYKKSISVLPS